MQILRLDFSIRLAAITLVLGLDGLASATSSCPRAPFCGLKPGTSITSSQRLGGEEFIGAPVSAKPVHPKAQVKPKSFGVHLDGANTRSVDYVGPLGYNLNVTSSNIRYAQFYWEEDGTPWAGYGGPCNGSTTDIVFAIAVLNPETYGIEAAWQIPAPYAGPNVTLQFSYAQLLTETGQMVVTTGKGQIFIIQKCLKANGTTTIELQRTIDLQASGVLKGVTLQNSGLDTAGNVWFTTGELGVATAGGANIATNSSIIGYVQPNGTTHAIQIDNQTIENGIALSNTSLFFVTGPSGADNHANAIGTVRAVEASPNGVHTKWNSTYSAGDGRKPGSFARGSGTTSGLLGNDFMVVTDNSNVQINLLIFRQNATGPDVEPVCKVPLLSPNSSWSDNSLIKHFDGKDYSIVVQNMWNEIPYNATFAGDDGAANNNLTVQHPGVQKVFIAGDGSDCHVEWTNPARINAAPVLSTATGLIYMYEQSEELANGGNWVWYASAIDFMTGETVWRVRTGAGGIFNNYYRTSFLGPDGTFYQPVVGGVVSVKDGPKDEC